VKAALPELFFDIQLAGILESEKRCAHPRDLVASHVALGNVDGGAGEVWTGDVAFGGRGVAVRSLKFLLIGDSADGRADLKRALEVGRMFAREVGEELRRPWAAIAMRFRQFLVDGKASRGGHWDEKVVSNSILQIVFVLNALKAVLAFGYFVLALE
jgi:hypothetical protein